MKVGLLIAADFGSNIPPLSPTVSRFGGAGWGGTGPRFERLSPVDSFGGVRRWIGVVEMLESTEESSER